MQAKAIVKVMKWQSLSQEHHQSPVYDESINGIVDSHCKFRFRPPPLHVNGVASLYTQKLLLSDPHMLWKFATIACEWLLRLFTFRVYHSCLTDSDVHILWKPSTREIADVWILECGEVGVKFTRPHLQIAQSRHT